ncbi:MAG TPA: ribonuclease III [Accumulibacter sp.]|uniref:ribonuclease III n=1 Tax=Accumulibacter sp. TaxID=2053492 RepID=UPI00261C0F60|nr:ribonuclease III [Accumulibacter sp.]HMV04549.1 ribonuclease III [Accumulibacter sp.]HMW63978.1 ribonuclease III [Accumulibacter sp.]HMW79737.1 ribonuclease III [Accumulibacter sp.]HNB66481.1 ribonuclease III [Accumulibacter sp.]HNC27190.1 ribonuclease III [Accumulibacter sp.]
MSAHPIERALAYTFRDQTLLQTALTHRSCSAQHNERLEFLGDAILNAIIAHCLFERFPALPEGDLSRLRAHLVRQDRLHQHALALSLGDFLRLGEGEQRSGGHRRPSILADAVEALFGALWLDAGFDAAGAIIARLYGAMLAELNAEQEIKDAKTRLQEYLQGRHLPLPRYTMLRSEGEAHAQQFTVRCELAAAGLSSEGSGSSRRAAEQVAAERALLLLSSS